MQRNKDRGITRREALRDIGAAGLGAGMLGAGVEGLLASAAAAAPKHGQLKDIEHVVFLIQENRSFDHYFGTLSGVQGFDDKHGRSAFFQKDGSESLHPYHLDSQCLPDLTHDWGPQHQSWDGGAMNGFLRAHNAADGKAIAVETMGYYKRSDLALYYTLADKFTVCDGYHCSVMGPTDPNRLMSMSASIDPAGTHGGPLVETLVATRTQKYGTFTWTTMPERLSAHGISWKAYNGSPGGILDNPLPYFKAFSTKGDDLYNRGIAPIFPTDFVADIAHGRLPQVSWISLGVLSSEHPGFSSPSAGEVGVRQVLEAVLSNKSLWEKTAVFITFDENGGFFDHVKPPTPPPGTKGEFLSVPTLPAAAAGIRGPIGLGFRVPMIIVSPFSRGGLVSSDVFDHTSMLRFLETRFGVEVPNLTPWRRQHTGDLTSAFNFAARPDDSRPSLPVVVQASCPTYAPPKTTAGAFPHPEPGHRGRPSGIVK